MGGWLADVQPWSAVIVAVIGLLAGLFGSVIKGAFSWAAGRSGRKVQLEKAEQIMYERIRAELDTCYQRTKQLKEAMNRQQKLHTAEINQLRAELDMMRETVREESKLRYEAVRQQRILQGVVDSLSREMQGLRKETTYYQKRLKTGPFKEQKNE